MSKQIVYIILIAEFLVSIALAKTAYCVLDQPAGSSVTGIIKFEQKNEDEFTVIDAEVYGLSPGMHHGFHIHEQANFTNGCVSAGSHYNPFENEHGGPNEQNRHVGDLGNLLGDKHGNSKSVYTDPVITLYGEYSIIGRACVVHANADDLGLGGEDDSKITGHAGARIACGKIELDTSSGGNFFLKVLILLGIGGAFYYVFVHRQKNRTQEYY